MDDLISRQAAIDALNGIINRFEQILRDIRESKVDGSVCGLCEYDGAYMGQSGDWCNECPGFDRDDCFKLSDKTRKEWTEEIIKALPSAQPEIIRCKECLWRIGRDCTRFTDLPVYMDDYCGRAKRRGEQDDESRSNSNAQTDTRARGMGATDKSSGI